MGVNFNVERAFEAYENSGDFQAVASSAANVIAEGIENAPEIRPAVIQGMNEVMKEMMGPEMYEMMGIPEQTAGERSFCRKGGRKRLRIKGS